MTDDAIAMVRAIERLSDEVRGVRLAIETFMAVPTAEPTSSAPVECEHPEELRVSFSSSGNEDFHCRACNTMVRRPLVAAQE